MDVIIALDQGTSSSRALAFNMQGECMKVSQQPITQYYPEDGWVEHCAEEIYQKTAAVFKEVINYLNSNHANIMCVGITNQRETTIVWDRKTGKPIHRAIVWQDRRTQPYCNSLINETGQIQSKTGLRLDPYFSATKIKWILDNCEGAKEKAQSGTLAFGTIDSYLIWRLTDGKHHKTDVTNASRTMLYNINEFYWDEDLLSLFSIPRSLLPEVLPCDGHYGEISQSQFGLSLPITGVIGDQQSASIGQQCFKNLDAKVTFGTGAFLMVNTGSKKQDTNHLLSTIAYKTKQGHAYALEGSIFNAGMIMHWLRDKLDILDNVTASEHIASSLNDNGGVYLVPAFTGLGAPHWQPALKAMMVGLQLDSTKSHIIRAALESVAYQVKDLLVALCEETGIKLDKIKVDGGMAQNRWLMQFLSDLCQTLVMQSHTLELTAQGAAIMAAVGAGVFNRLGDCKDWYQIDWQCQTVEPKFSQYEMWQNAVAACKGLR